MITTPFFLPHGLSGRAISEVEAMMTFLAALSMGAGEA